MSSPATFDAPELSRAYADLRRQEGRPNDEIETPALRSLLPALTGLRVVDLGCGAGQMASWAADQGASAVRAFDASARMIEKARAAAGRPVVEYAVLPMEDIALAPGSADVVMSGLAFHYIQDIEALFSRIHGWLAPGGLLAFSVEHPIMTCAARAWFHDERGERLHWPVDHYLEEGGRTVEWLGTTVERVHRTVSSYARALIGAGFQIVDMREPAPTSDQIERWPALGDHRRRPPFLLMAGRSASTPGTDFQTRTRS